MSTNAPDQVDSRAALGGTVFDIGYRSYTGLREGRGRSRLAVFKDGVRTALGLGRGTRAKILPWLFIAVLAGIALIMVVMAGAAMRLGGQAAVELLRAQGRLPSHADFYGLASVVLFVFAAVVAPELLCPDRRQGTINLYLVRPLTGTDYIVSRWLAFLVIMVGASWLPQVILFLGLSMGSPDTVAYLRDNWLDVPRFLAAGFAMAAYITTLAMLTASFTTRRAYASVFLIGLFVVSTPFTVGVASEVEGVAGQWISMFNLTNIPVHVNDVIFGEVSNITEIAPARALGPPILIGWYFAWTVVPALALWSRYRRLTP